MKKMYQKLRVKKKMHLEMKQEIACDRVEANEHGTDGNSTLNDSSGESDFGFVEEVDSSDSEQDIGHVSSDNEEPCLSLKEKIIDWSTKNKLTRSCLDELLVVLKSEGLQVPKDARTLLQTPKTVNSEEKCGGRYIYYGIKNGLVKILHGLSPCTLNNLQNIYLNINIDGVPLFKSSGKQFWLILCSFEKFPPFIISLYLGNSKPSSLHEFLDDFLSELEEIIRQGVRFEDKTFQVEMRAFIYDAPARAFLKQVKGHTGYFSCERCLRDLRRIIV
ncbi:unnamed protein product [Mytilus coruscus]|uniref:Transposase domain-containing protein n=1 Tax=Mytilus coruscus TaxID=42192 RepID=A0A6J8A463_MYTCO|nr:unnamed protein product [Mytilus coruscus]